MNEQEFAGLLRDLESPEFTKAESAAVKITSLRDRRFQPLIENALRTGSPVVQRVMLWALQNYPVSGYTAYFPWLASDDANVREACQVLFMKGGDAAVDALRNVVSSPDISLQTAAVDALAVIRIPSAGSLLMAFLDSRDADVRLRAVSALSVYQDSAVSSALVAHLTDSDTGVLTVLLSVLRGRILSFDELKQVFPLLSSGSESVRAGAVAVLGTMVPDTAASDPSPAVRRAVAESTASSSVLLSLCQDSHPSVRLAAVTSAAKIQAVSLELLVSLMHDEHPGVRRAAAEAMGVLHGTDADAAVPVLAEALRDKRPGIRVAAVNSLVKIGTPAAKEVLETAIDDSNPLLSGIIKNAVSKFL